MILYKGTAKEFVELAESSQLIDELELAFKIQLGRKLPKAEIGAYLNSLPFISRVVRRAQVADDCGVFVEYMIPSTSNRIDFVIAGKDDSGQDNFVIVELKQWQKAEATDSEGIVKTAIGRGIRETTHPSYQANSYREFLEDFNNLIGNGTIRAYACASLHNYKQQQNEPLLMQQYLEILKVAPVFFRGDQEKLEMFIAKHVKRGKGTDILYSIENGKVRPTKKLISYVSGLLKGNQEFILLDEQKVAYEKAKSVVRKGKGKSVVIIKGGPGTGKSVISVNLLGSLLKEGFNTAFIAPNSSFRDVLVKKLGKEHGASRVKHLFRGSGGFVDTEPDSFDALVIDEAHRLKRKGAYMYQGLNQVEDIIKAAKTSIFFVDDDQAIRPEDIGTAAEINRAAHEAGAGVYEVELTAQFRCSGAEGYINWLDHTLRIKETANYDGWGSKDFEFKIFDNPNDLKKAIHRKSQAGHSARILAGYAWDWTSAKEGNADAEVEDVSIPEFDFCMPWNSRRAGTTWAIDQDGIHQAGCIHTSQGLEFDYVGVIVGDDLAFDPKSFSYKTDYTAYKDKMGKRGLKEKPVELNRLVRNIYKILMSRGMRGCYVYFTNKDTEQFFKERLKKNKK